MQNAATTGNYRDRTLHNRRYLMRISGWNKKRSDKSHSNDHPKHESNYDDMSTVEPLTPYRLEEPVQLRAINTRWVLIRPVVISLHVITFYEHIPVLE